MSLQIYTNQPIEVRKVKLSKPISLMSKQHAGYPGENRDFSEDEDIEGTTKKYYVGIWRLPATGGKGE